MNTQNEIQYNKNLPPEKQDAYFTKLETKIKNWMLKQNKEDYLTTEIIDGYNKTVFTMGEKATTHFDFEIGSPQCCLCFDVAVDVVDIWERN